MKSGDFDQLTDNALASFVGASDKTIAGLRRTFGKSEGGPRVGRDGKTYKPRKKNLEAEAEKRKVKAGRDLANAKAKVIAAEKTAKAERFGFSARRSTGVAPRRRERKTPGDQAGRPRVNRCVIRTSKMPCVGLEPTTR